jgi:hypothetical protein
LIEVVNGKDISRYTNYPNENEVILCPGTRFHVVSVSWLAWTVLY